MNKKKKRLTVIIIISVIVLGIYLMRFLYQGSQDKQEEIQNVATTEPGIGSTAEPTAEPMPEASIEPTPESDGETDAVQKQSAEGNQQPEGEQQEEQVRVVEDEEVRNNPTFAAFIDKEIPAYDEEEGKGRYIYEYYADYARIEHVHYMAEDLNQDTKNELLVYIERTWGYGDLLVFEEKESGELIAWEKWCYIISDRQPDIYYCGNGIFMRDGVSGVSVEQYTQEGVPEPLLDYYHRLVDNNDTYYMMNILLILYENGEVVKEMAYERYCDVETHKDIIGLESEEAREGEKIKDEILAALGEQKEVSIDEGDKVKTVLLEELQSP